RLATTQRSPWPHPQLRHSPPSLPPRRPSTTQPSPSSLHDALPISERPHGGLHARTRDDRSRSPSSRLHDQRDRAADRQRDRVDRDRKSTRLNSSHLVISYAVFCLKKKSG